MAEGRIGANVSCIGDILRSIVLYVVSAIVVFCLAENVASRSFSAPWFLALNSPASAGLAVALIVSVAAITDAILGRRYVSLVPIAAACIGLAYLSSEKIKYLSEPLYPWDFLSVKQVGNLLPILLKGGTTGDRLCLFIALAVTVGLAWLTSVVLRRSERFGWLQKLILSLLALPLLAWSGWLLQPEERSLLRDRTGIQDYKWDQPANYSKNGHLLGFVLNLNSALISVPSGYSQKTASDWAPTNGKTAKVREQVRPNVIVIMSEAFWDLTLLPKVRFSEDPMSFVRDPEMGAKRGWLFSPQLAGGTCNVEFEVLTGFSNAFLPTGSIPYQQYIRSTLPSLPRFLKDKGYKTLAVHPYHKWFWNRSSVYRNLGFDAFLGLEDMGDMPKQGFYVGDTAVMEKLHRLIVDETDPVFLFAITMQNHGPYEPNRFGATQIEAEGKLSAGEREAVRSYAQGIKISDTVLKKLVLSLKAQDEPTLLIFFGDHLPYLGPNSAAFRSTGFIGTEPVTTTLDYKRMHQTPLLIWSNFGAELPELQAISPSVIPYVIARALNIQHPYFSNILGRRFASVPVVERRMVIDAQGEIFDRKTRELPPPLEEDLQEQWMLEYDILFGERRALSSLFCEVDASCAGGEATVDHKAK